jgi:hypothetical protein
VPPSLPLLDPPLELLPLELLPLEPLEPPLPPLEPELLLPLPDPLLLLELPLLELLPESSSPELLPPLDDDPESSPDVPSTVASLPPASLPGPFELEQPEMLAASPRTPSPRRIRFIAALPSRAGRRPR